MIVLICGDRHWTDTDTIRHVLEGYVPQGATIIHGDNGYDKSGIPLWGQPDELAVRGADKLAGAIARSLGHEVIAFTPEWIARGKSAGPLRNALMLEAGPTLVIAFHNNLASSRGTHDMIRRALRANVRVLHVRVEDGKPILETYTDIGE